MTEGALTLSLDWLPAEPIVLFAIFCRVGAFFMTAPALGDYSLSPRIRLAAALLVTLALGASVSPLISSPDATNALALATLIGGEVAVGVFLGVTARVFVSALNVAGQIIAFQMGLAISQIFDPTQELQGAIVGGFLAILGTTLIFVTDAHHLLLAAMSRSYLLFAPGASVSIGDMSEVIITALSNAFALGVQLSAPFILFGLVFYIGAGALNRLMPQAQVFFMVMPANLALGILLLMTLTGAIMTVFLTRFEAFLLGLTG